MNTVLQILLAAMAGWLTGKLVGKKGYALPLLGGFAGSLDIFFGVVGASIGGNLFFPDGIARASSFGGYLVAVLGAIVLVGACRLISGRYLRARSDKEISRTPYIE